LTFRALYRYNTRDVGLARPFNFRPKEVDVRRLKKCVFPAGVALVASLLAALPAQAGPSARTDDARRSSLTTLSPATLARLQQSTQQTQPPTGGDTSPAGSFFKSKKGAATLALIGAGFGYALYSKVHDRVLSPVR
jgi:hypothetical protein